MRTVLALIFALFTLPAFSQHPANPSPAQPNNADQVIAKIENGFLRVCTGVEVNDDLSYSLALVSCMGRTRGLADGHMLTVSLANRQGGQAVRPMWCVPYNVTDGQLYTSVLQWVVFSNATYQEILKRSGSSAEAATLSIMRALMQTYPCKTV